jgi:hypothetical protein
MLYQKIVLPLFEKVRPSVRRHPSFFAILGSTIVFSTVVIKDNLSEDVRSHVQGVESAAQFYSLHNQSIELNARLAATIERGVQELQQKLGKENSDGDLQRSATMTTQNYNEAYRNEKLAEATNDDTEELMKHVDDSEFMFLWTGGEERSIRYNVKSSKCLFESFSVQLQEVEDSLDRAVNTVSGPKRAFTPQEIVAVKAAFDRAKSKSEAALAQSMYLRADSEITRKKAANTTESYRQLLETENRICKWVIICLVVIGTLIGLLSQLVGGQSPEVRPG